MKEKKRIFHVVLTELCHDFVTIMFLVVMVKGTCLQLKKACQNKEKILFQIHKTSASLEELKIN